MGSSKLLKLFTLPVAFSVIATAAPSVLAVSDNIDPNGVPVTTAEAGHNYEVEEGGTVQYFEFTPEHDGFYIFYTLSYVGDPVLTLYDPSGAMIDRCDDYSIDDEERDATMVVALHEGFRFIVAVSSYHDGPLEDYQFGISEFWLEGMISCDADDDVYNSGCVNPYGCMYEADASQPLEYEACGYVEPGSEARCEAVCHCEDFPEDVSYTWWTWSTAQPVPVQLDDHSNTTQTFPNDINHDNVEIFYQLIAEYDEPCTGNTLTLNLKFVVRNDNHLALVDRTPENYLVTPGRAADITMNVTCEDPFLLSCGSNNPYYAGGVIGSLETQREPNDQPRHIFYADDGYLNMDFKDIYIFSFIVEDISPINHDQAVHVTAPSAGQVEQRIYKFIPETTGTYTISSFDLTCGDPYVAVFDSNRNCVACDDNVNGDPWEISEEQYMQMSNNNTLDRNFNLQCGLTAGETYYIAIPFNSLSYDRNDDFYFKILLTAIPVRPSTPGSTDEPGQTPSSEEPQGTTPAAPSGTTPAPVSETGVAGFVERLYTVALGRNSDPAGKQDWIEAITLRGETGADCARGFLYSPEFLGKDISNEEFVRVLYRTFFDREPDQAGFNAWVAVLDNGTTKQEVIEGFINSTEWANLCLSFGIRGGGTGSPNITVEPNQQTIDFATRLYTTCLNRQADPDGLMAWARQLANQRDTGTGAARGFFFSEEFLGQNTSNGDYISRLYRTFMGREPDGAGFVAWMNQLESGVSREEVFRGFAESTEFARICASYGIIR